MQESTFSITEEFLSEEPQQYAVRWREAMERYLSDMLSKPPDGTEKAERELLY